MLKGEGAATDAAAYRERTMNMRHMKAALVSMVAASALFVAGQAAARDVAGWKVEGTGSTIAADTKYKLYNLDQKTRMVFDDRWGANWGWNANAQPNAMFKRKSGSGPIKCGETFALMVDNRAVVYAKQDWGINLSDRTKLDKDEYYQWKFSGCSAGQPVSLNANVTLLNTVENDTLVGCKRAKGVNMCWANDMKSVAGKNYRRADAPF